MELGAWSLERGAWSLELGALSLADQGVSRPQKELTGVARVKVRTR